MCMLYLYVCYKIKMNNVCVYKNDIECLII